MSTPLFTPFHLKGITLRNRIVVSPMCQYMATDGVANEWHSIHYPGLARGGSGLVIVEATGVSPEGRISPACLGLWNNTQAAALAPIVASIKAAGAVPGIQIGHAGRKASANIPWGGDDHIAAGDPRGWETIAPSAIPFGANLPRTPREMTKADIDRVREDFVSAAKRALDAGFEWLVLHFAHGYLAQSFFSDYSNQRTDEYGGNVQNRSRFLLETLAAVRKVWPEHLPLTARFGVLEFDGRDEETLSDSIGLIQQFKSSGLDLIDVSIGFSTPTAKIPWGAAFMAPNAARVRKETGLPTTTSWFLSEPAQCNSLIADDQLDLVSLARPLLVNPHWPFRAATELGYDKWVLPAPYSHWLSRYRVS